MAAPPTLTLLAAPVKASGVPVADGEVPFAGTERYPVPDGLVEATGTPGTPGAVVSCPERETVE